MSLAIARSLVLSLLGACMVFVASSASAADNLDRFEAKEYKSPSGGVLKYRLLKPKADGDDESAKYPLVVFLHGAGERGNDNKAQLVHGMRDFASDEIMQKYPAYVIAPQCPSGEKWSNVDWGAAKSSLPEKPADAMQMTMDVVDQLIKDEQVDPTRLYITGLSMGGYGTWDAIQRWPDKWAAAAPICGGGDPAGAEAMKNTPIWAFHGDQDQAVKVTRSREMIAALKAAGAEPKYTEYPGVGHDSWTATYKNPDFYAWMFAQKREAKK